MLEHDGSRFADEIGWVAPVDDPDFVGVRPEVEQIFHAVAEGSGDRLTKEEERAAQLMARMLDAAAVDVALNLPSGTVKGLFKQKVFARQVMRYRDQFVRNRPADEDFARILSPKQRTAARMRRIDMCTQIEAAEAVGVTTRTIYNWELMPQYRMYQEQLEREEDERRRRWRIKHSDHVLEVKEKALTVYDKALDQNDLKAAGDVLRLRD